MKRFLTYISFFFAIVFFLFFELNLFQFYYNNEPVHYKLQYRETLNPKSSYNGIIIGNSQATHSIIPSKLDNLGVQFYNLALNGASPNFYSKWLDKLFIKNHPMIDYWIISVDYNFISGNGWRKLEHDSEYFPKKSFWNLLIKDKNIDRKLLIANRIPLFKYRSTISKKIKKGRESWIYPINDYDRGYISLGTTGNTNFNRSKGTRNEVSQETKMNFIKLIDKITKLEGKIIFVIPPEYDFDSSQYTNYKQFLISLSKIRNISLYDFNDSCYHKYLKKTENYVDPVHLNKKGSELFSTILSKTLYQDKNATLYMPH